nr:hypothetical protein MBKG4397_9220 [Mycoplasmopsis bovis]
MSLLKIKKSTYYKKLKKLKIIREKNLELENTEFKLLKKLEAFSAEKDWLLILAKINK